MKEITKEFERLLEILNRLLGPGGCPWDREQTMQSLRYSVLEETCELIEAINLDDNPHICEELGDLFLNATFLCKLAQNEERFSFQNVLQTLNDKLVRRHPHVFSENQEMSPEEVVEQWDAIKKKEKAERTAKSVLDDIPQGLPGLVRAQKSLKRMCKNDFDQIKEAPVEFSSEEDLGDLLLQVARQAREKGLDAEHALRKQLAFHEQEFREFETACKK